MPGPYVVREVQSREELQQVLALQHANLKTTVDADEAREQGFLTVAHDLPTLERMHAVAPSVIALQGTQVAAYALVMPRECRALVPVLGPMFDLLDTLEYRGRPLEDSRFYVMGQICVGKAHRGEGLFDALYQRHRELLHERYTSCVTEVSVRNLRSLRAHARVGFQTLHTYRDASDTWAVVLWDWELPSVVR